MAASLVLEPARPAAIGVVLVSVPLDHLDAGKAESAQSPDKMVKITATEGGGDGTYVAFSEGALAQDLLDDLGVDVGAELVVEVGVRGAVV